MGTPNEEVWKGVSKLKDYKKEAFPDFKPKSFLEICPSLGELGADLLHKLLLFDPVERISPKEALKHPFFNDLVIPGAIAVPMSIAPSPVQKT